MSLIASHVDGAVKRVRLCRPDKRNALTAEMIADLTVAFTAEPTADERVAVLEAEGPSFCAGFDMRSRDATPGGAQPLERLLQAIETYPLPVVAVVQGPAITGGALLALHCDLVVADETAPFGMSSAQVGLAPSWLFAKKILEAAGPVLARKLLLVGDPVSAVTLRDLGIVGYVAPAGELAATAEGVIGRLAANAPLSMRAIKQTLVRAMSFRDGIAHEDIDGLLGVVRSSQDALEGTAARLERRPPVFRGR